MRRLSQVLAAASVLVWTVSARCQSILDEIAESHIQANVPAAADFDTYLRRDLEAYFLPAGAVSQARLEYEFLRRGPTQTGVGYPKFYVWVKVRENERVLREGAARIAAIERKRFEITDFVAAEDIRRSPDAIYQTFPGPVCERIKEKVGPTREGVPPN